MSRRRGRALLRGTLVLVVVIALVGVGGVCWYFSGTVVQVDRTRSYPQLVQRLLPDAVQLSRDQDSERPGNYGLAWAGGYGQVGAPSSSTSSSVIRPFTSVRGTPDAGTSVRIDPYGFEGDPRTAVDLDYEDILLRSDVGNLPTWYVPGDDDATTWVVFVHGRGGTREESLRYLRTWHEAGLPVVVPSYRNDLGAPASPDGRCHLGDTEWRDAAAAVQWALVQGARDVVLAGWSMGGAIALQLIDRAAVGSAVRAVVLDSPVLDWRDTFRSQGTHRGIPAWLTAIAVRTLEVRSDIDLDRFDWVARARDLSVPVLLVHSDEDTSVPDGPSRAIAALRPDLVTFVEIPDAEHTRGWNVDPDRYRRTMADWLENVGALDPATEG